jgi:phosphatidylserine/phosphatidylglycerophosphate/cardiolipin synthase-like enzyme
LNDVLLLSKNSLHIISPWIGSNVVTDGMLDTIRGKIQDGVQIHIIFGHKAVRCSLDDINELVKKDIPWRKDDAAAVIRSLKELLGDMLQFSPPSHVKLLLVDDKYLFIGSLNWLFNSGKTDQKEISCLITNPGTIAYVKERFLTNKKPALSISHLSVYY